MCLISSQLISQTTRKPISQKEKDEFLSSKNYQFFENQLDLQSFKSKRFIPEGTFRVTNKKSGEKYDLGLITYEVKENNNSLTNKSKPIIIIITEFRNYITGESISWVEKEDKILTISPDQKLIENQNLKLSAVDCFTTHLKPGIQSCTNCINCINNSCKNKKKWSKVACLLTNCGSKCAPCVVSLYNFIRCCVGI